MIYEYPYVGSAQTFVFGTTYPYLIELWGALAEGSDLGSEGYVNAVMQLSSNSTWYLYVGGSTAGTGNPFAGGWNGGGAGGAVTTGVDNNRGYGGGGMTELRTNTSTTASYKLLVAGGSGGGSGHLGGKAGQSGKLTYPAVINSDGSRVECGGDGGSATSGGAGGLAPIAILNSDVPSETRYVSSGGGGGAGYYGGGGGSSGYLITTTNKTYTAGSAGSQGVGGAGGSFTSGVLSWNSSSYGGSGGGGSNYVSTTSTILSSSCYPESGTVLPDKPHSGYFHGFARVSEIISTPIIKSVERDGDYYIVKIGKSLNNGIPELFYCKVTDSPQYRVTGLESVGYGKAYTITNDELVTIRYRMKYSTKSTVDIYVSATNGRDFVNETHSTNVLAEVPTLVVDETKLNGVHQGKFVKGLFTLTKTNKHKGNYKFQTTLTFPSVNQEPVVVEHTENDSIYLPFLYDGVNNEEYQVNLSTRAYQTSDTTNGIGAEIEIGTFKKDNIIVKVNKQELNDIVIQTDLKNKKIEKDTILSLDWTVSASDLDTSYKVSMYDSQDKVVQDFYLTSSELANQKKILLSYPQGEYYFGIYKMKNGVVVTTPIFTDRFYVYKVIQETDIKFTDLNLQTNFSCQFKKIVVEVNGISRFSEVTNLNTTLPIWMFKNGENNVAIKIFFDDKEYVSYDYRVVASYNIGDSPIEPQINVSSSYSINNNDLEFIDLRKELEDMIDLEYKEISFVSKRINYDIVDIITQKFIISKKEGLTIIPQIATITGGIE